MFNISSNFRYEASYATRLPESLSGQEFLEKYLDHDDSVTTIEKEHNYSVRAPTRHPIYENFRVKVQIWSFYSNHFSLNNFSSSLHLITLFISCAYSMSHIHGEQLSDTCINCYQAFKALLSAAPSNYQLSALGELMYQVYDLIHVSVTVLEQILF